MVFITIAVATASAIVTGAISYFAFRSTPEKVNSGATAEIRNDVNIQEKEADPHSIVTNVLLTIIAVIKLIELTLYFVNRCRNAFKKKYERKAAAITSRPSVPV